MKNQTSDLSDKLIAAQFKEIDQLKSNQEILVATVEYALARTWKDESIKVYKNALNLKGINK